LSERQLTFSVSLLNRIAAMSIGHSESDFSSIEKLAEGGFNCVLQIIMRDWTQLVARLLYPSAELKQYTTASEIATMGFVRFHGVSVLRVFDYSSTAKNSLGSDYIIMEKAKWLSK
jgi:hypothetical protein